MNVEKTSPQMDSASYRLAALDQDFLLSDAMRGVRFLLWTELLARGLVPDASIELAHEQEKP
jgi:hypothetical protein